MALMKAKPSVLDPQPDTIAELRTIQGYDGQVLQPKGYYSANDGAGMPPYIWDATSTATDNSGTIIQVTGVTTGRWLAEYSGAVYIEWFGTDNGATDNSSAAQAAIDTEENVLSGSDSLLIETPLTESPNGKLNIDFGSTTITQGTDNKIINVQIPYANTQSVSSLAKTTYNYGGGNSEVSSITVTNGAAYTVGNIAKIYSDDTISHTGALEKYGEHFIIGAISGNVLYSKNILEFHDEYTTTISVSEMGSSDVDVKGGIFTTLASGDAALWNADLIHIEGCKEPTLSSTKIIDGYGAGIVIKSCWKATVDSPVISGLRNDTANNRYGYGIKDHSSFGTLVISPRIADGRHGYTTAQTSSPTDVASYGQPMYCKVENGIAVGTFGVSFDFHADAWKCEFNSCIAYGSVIGDTASGTGFQFRGWHNRIVNCKTYNCQQGLNIYQQFTDSNKYNKALGCEFNAYNEAIVYSNSITSAITDCSIIECDTNSYDGTKTIYLAEGNYYIKGGKHRLHSATNFRSILTCGTDCQVIFEDAEIEHTSSTGTSRYIGSIEAATSDIALKNIKQIGQPLETIFSTGGNTGELIALGINLNAALNVTYIEGYRGIADTSINAWIEYSVNDAVIEFLVTGDFTDQTHYVNRFKKFERKNLWNTTISAPVWASGSGSTAVWVDGSGATVHTPV